MDSVACYQACITADDGAVCLDRDGKGLRFICIICRAGDLDIIAVLDSNKGLDGLFACIRQVVHAGISFRIQFCLVGFCY